MPKKQPARTTIEHTTSSGNVFRDLGLPDADDMLVKSELTMLINGIIRRRKLTQSQAADAMQVDQADASRLFNNRLTRFSIERLFTVLNNLGYAVEIRVTEAKKTTVKSRAKNKPLTVVKSRPTAA